IYRSWTFRLLPQVTFRLHPQVNRGHSPEGNPGSLLRVRRLEFPSRTLGKPSAQYSRLLSLAEFLETRIAAKRIEHGIESKQCRSEWRAYQPIHVRHRQKFL